MTKEALSDTDAAKLFASVAQNWNDPTKVDELMDASPKEEPATEPAKTEDTTATTDVGDTPGTEPTVVSGDDLNRDDPGNTTTDEPSPDGKADVVKELETLKQKYEQLEHRYRSDDGRVAAYQRKVRELEDKLAALDVSKITKPAEQPASSTLDPSEVEAAAALEELKRVDPALYKILVARDAAHKKEIENIKAAVSTELAPVRQTVTTYEREREKTKLKELIPNIEEVVVSEEFLAYRESAPLIVQQWLKSKSADDVVEGMKAYALHLQLSGKIPVTPPTQPAAPAAKPASPIQSERDRKLATSVNVGSSPAAPVRKELSDEELFAQFYDQLHKGHKSL